MTFYSKVIFGMLGLNPPSNIKNKLNRKKIVIQNTVKYFHFRRFPA